MASGGDSHPNLQQQNHDQHSNLNDDNFENDTDYRAYDTEINIPFNQNIIAQQPVQQPMIGNGQFNYPHPMPYQQQFPISNYHYMNQQMYGEQSYAQHERHQAMIQRTTNMTSAPTMSYLPSVPPPFVHSLTERHQSSVPTYQHVPPAQSAMNNGIGTSTPRTNKRGQGDVSGNSEHDPQRQMNQQFRTRVVNNSVQNQARSAYKRQRPNAQQTNANQSSPRCTNALQGLNFGPVSTTDNSNNMNGPSVNVPITVAACRFASTRYPFSPFTILFSETVRDVQVVDELIGYAKNTHAFDLKTVAYRLAHTEGNGGRILIFVENVESFSFLHDETNWPQTLVGLEYVKKLPSIPPQLSLVLPSVPFQMDHDWDEFVQDIKNQYVDVVNVIRLKNKSQRPVRSVKIELKSAKCRQDISASGQISALHMKFIVVEYYAQANVLICSNCYKIGHFRKNCPQQGESTCKVCGEK